MSSRGNHRSPKPIRWEHRAVHRWDPLPAGERRSLEVLIGGYVMLRQGAVEVSSSAFCGRAEGPKKIAVGGGEVVIEAYTDAELALGTADSFIAVILDRDAGWASELWTTLGLNRRPLRTTNYRR